MAKMSRFLMGGLLGAGLALLFAPKTGRELRRMLMGSGQRALPSAEEPTYEPPAPREAAVDLESRIEETRREVEERLAEPYIPATGAAVPEAGVEEGAVAEVEAEAELEVAPEEEEEPVEAEALVEEEEKPEEAELLVEEEDEISVLKTPVDGEPTMEEAAPEPGEQVAAEPAPEPASGAERISREEMRKRIEDTRAKLKAKAFDAMVSGETFIETEADKAEEAKEEPGIELDEETEEKIDESLKEMD